MALGGVEVVEVLALGSLWSIEVEGVRARAAATVGNSATVSAA